MLCGQRRHHRKDEVLPNGHHRFGLARSTGTGRLVGGGPMLLFHRATMLLVLRNILLIQTYWSITLDL